MNQRPIHLLQLGIAIFIMSSSGTLGRFIDLPPPITIWLRAIIATLTLFILIKILKVPLSIGWGRQFNLLFISSIFFAGHWVSYFYSLQMSTVAIGMLSMFTYPVMTAILEPIILKTKFDKISIWLSLIAFVGVYFLAPNLDFNNSVTLGVGLGLVSALLYSLRNILLKKNISQHSGLTLMLYQMAIIVLLLFPIVFFFDLEWKTRLTVETWEALLILGVLTSAVGHTLFVKSFRFFTVSTVSILSCLTPLLGTGLGFLVLGEVPKGRTLLAGSIILATAVIESYRSIRSR